MLRFVLPAVALLGWLGPAVAEPLAGNAAPPNQAAPPPPPDHLKEAVDPLNLAGEKMRFFAAAGVDNELSAEEFVANQNADPANRPFARRFDSFRTLRLFDKDRNGKIDWLEAEQYRLNLREKLLAKFDRNRNGRLDADERDAANHALHHGEGLTVAQQEGSKADVISAEMVQRFDADGDGMLNEAELKAASRAMRADRRAERLARWDTDRDGKLSKAERQAMWKQQRSHWETWRNRQFDEDGDGKVSEEEKQAAKAFMKEMGQIGELFQKRNMDFDGDGTISKSERATAQKEWAIVGIRMQLRRRALMDTSGDGQVTADERVAFERKFNRGVQQWWEGFSRTYDIDASGRLDSTERKQLLVGVRQELTRRMDKHDDNKDGRVSAFEAEKMLMEFSREIGLLGP